MRKSIRTARRATATKVVASVALVAGAASVAGLGTFGAFSSTTSASQEVASGTVVLGSAAPSTAVKVGGLVPADSVQRAVTLTRAAGSEKFGSVKLTTTASGATKLSSDVVNGLQVSVDECSAPWTVAGTSLTCAASATTTPVIATRAVVAEGLDLAGPLARVNAAGAASYLRVTLSLPATANNDFQNLGTTVGFTFDASQRAGEVR